MRISWLSILMATLLAACGTQNPPAPQTQNQRPNSGDPDYHFSDDMPDTIEFEQGYGEQLDVLAIARVPGPGTPVVTAENLPDGSTFDGREFSWIPPCGTSAIEFQRGFAEFKIRFTLWSSEDNKQFVQRRINLRVYPFHDGPGRVCGDPLWRESKTGSNLTERSIYFDQNFQETMPFFQGTQQGYDIMSVVHAFPSGQVSLTVDGLPDGATFDGNQLIWKPSCADNASYVNSKRTVAVTFHAAKVGDETLRMDRRASLVVHQQTPCTESR